MTRGMFGYHGVPNLQPDDLVDDRELAAAEDDRLAHEGIVDQLAGLATTVTTPLNVALYGPWGSGKSGIANLLKSKIDNRNGVRFVRFDAFKYADVPLRRNFISAVASELGCKQSKYHGDLYSGRTRTEVKVPPATLLRLLGAFALLLLVLTGILAGVVLLIAWGQSRIGANTDFGVEFKSLSQQVVLAGLAPATLLAALVTLASKTFTVDRSLAKPESDEEFEAIFRSLVSDANAKRLVIFVDELDRCSASEVVTTLDTIRTFLGIDQCVFIVAADQNVLEGALTRAVKQETPTDDSNPYYSTGSAYLDKVFQYQLSLPPLLTQSVSKYATSLIEAREGLWAEINREYVLSVLIPTHVASPRRVKHLLNTFALTYRLAQARHNTNLLAENPNTSAPAIARLVCLRVEFPLFARHLESESNLPSLVLQLLQDRNAEFPAGTSSRSVELARSYALGNAAPSAVLIDDDPEGGDEDDGRAVQIGKAHNKQLLNYLSRTRQVQGPSRDLIYMQSSGTIFGLDGELAFAVERAAEDADIDTLQRCVDGLEDKEREGVLQVLTNQIRTGVGLSAPNAARSLLLLMEAEPSLPVVSVADTVAEEICVLEGESSGFLDEDTTTSAWALAKVGSEASANALRHRVIDAIARPGFTPPDFFFADAVVALDTAPATVTDYLSQHLVSSAGPAALTRLFELGDDAIIRILGEIRPCIVDLSQEAARNHLEWKNVQKAAGSTGLESPDNSTVSLAETEPFNPKGVLDALASEASSRETPVQHAVLRLLLAIDAQHARDAARQLLGKTEPIGEQDLVASVLSSVHYRALPDWSAWLTNIDPAAIAAAHVEPLATLVAKVWEKNAALEATPAALDVLTPLISGLPADSKPSLTPDMLEIVENHVANTEEASARIELLERGRLFAEAGVLEFDWILITVARSLQDTLAEPLEPVGADDALYRYIRQNGSEALRASTDELEDHEVHGLLSEAATSPWLDELGRVAVPLEFAMAVGPARVRHSDLPTVRAMADVTYNFDDLAVHAAALWLELTQPNPADFAAVYDPLRRVGSHGPDLIDAAAKVQRSWTAEQHGELLDKYLAAADAEVPNDATLCVLGLANADESRVADLLISRFSGARNNAQRQAVITLWEKASPQNNVIRRRLVESIIYELLDLNASGGNVGAAEVALKALGSVGSPLPPKTKRALGERVKTAVTGTPKLEDRALAVLPELGYKTATSFLGKSKRIRYDD